MPSEARQKKIMEKLNSTQKCSILGPQNLGSRGARAPGAPPGSAPGSPIHRHDLIQGTDYIANPFFLNLKVSKTTIENLR